VYICCCCRVQQRVERENIYRRWQFGRCRLPRRRKPCLNLTIISNYTKVAVANTISPTMAVTRTLALRLMEVRNSFSPPSPHTQQTQTSNTLTDPMRNLQHNLQPLCLPHRQQRPAPTPPRSLNGCILPPPRRPFRRSPKGIPWFRDL
jgi:hypothetical protein